MQTRPMNVFNVHDFGASGKQDDDALPAIQQAVDACAEAGGGVVYFPPGSYTTGTIHLRSHVRILVEAGAVIYASKDPAHFDIRGLFYAEDVENISLEGRGTINGQATYERRLNDMTDWYIYPNQIQAEQAGLPLIRAFPTQRESIAHLVLFVRCLDVRIRDLSFLNSSSWTMHLWGCERLLIDGVYIYTTQRDGVWADGIDPDGCKDVQITNCTIETGDDALVFYSSNIFGPARPCENITVTNCRLSSASSGLKFCDGNMNAIRNVTISNCVITGSNRGIAFMLFDGGVLENVVISDVVIDCKRYEWFWWGDGDPIHFNLIQRSEIDSNIDKTKEPPPGIIRNVILRNVIARGSGSCLVHGHVNSPLENVLLENVRIAIAHEAGAAPRKAEHLVKVENARNFHVRNLELVWDEPLSEAWRSALVVQNVQDLVLDEVSARQAPNGVDAPAIVLDGVDGGVVKYCQAQPGTGTFLSIRGKESCDLALIDNNTRHAQQAVALAEEVDPTRVIQH